MDRNHDGLLSPSELPGGHGKPVTRGEHRARLAAAFARQDRDRDGFLDAGELATPPQ
jgi:Ca2+-binding EF-hand superfamily protein